MSGPSRPGILDRAQIREANALLRRAEAELSTLAVPAVKEAAAASGPAGARLNRDGAQYAALVRSLKNSVNHPYFGCFRSLRNQMTGIEKARAVVAKDQQVLGAVEKIPVAGREISLGRFPDTNGGPDARIHKIAYKGERRYVSASDLQWLEKKAAYNMKSSADGRDIPVSPFGTGDFNRAALIGGKPVYFNRDQVVKRYELGKGLHLNYSLLPLEDRARGIRRVYLAIGGWKAEPVYVTADVARKYFDAAGGLKREWT